MRQRSKLDDLIIPVIESLELEFFGLERLGGSKKHSVLRVYIDSPKGVSTEDCQKVSRRLGAVLDVESNFQGPYTLEVSSPGMDRILFTEAQMKKEIGKQISVKLSIPLEGQRNFKGILQGVDNNCIQLVLPLGEKSFSFTDIDQVRLVPSWSA